MAPMFQIQESRRSLAADVGQAGQLARTGGSLIGDGLRQFLKTKTFLGGLSDAALDALLRRGHVKKYVAGEVICRRQEQGDSLMIIIRGLIKIANDNPDGKEIVLNFLGTGDTYGEMAVFGGQTRTADAVALEASEAFAVYARDLMPVLAAHPQALFEIVQVLCEKLRAASSAIEDNSLDMRRRLARGLWRLAQQHGKTSRAGIRVNLTLSQGELAAYLGLARENVNRLLGQLREANVIRKEGTQIVVTDEVALCEIAQEAR
jgi:CRP/FNR family cyclic AMP-dependent transcriptional regulator